MILGVPSNIQTWEAIALISIVRGMRDKVPGVAVSLAGSLSDDVKTLFVLAGVGVYGTVEKEIDLASAYIAAQTADSFYGSVLARLNGLEAQVAVPKFPFVACHSGKTGIVLAPFGLRPEFDLPSAIWKGVHRHLEGYGEPVYVVGDAEQRLAVLPTSEQEILSDVPMTDRLYAVANARLIVGVANAYTWASAAFSTPRLLFQPETVRNDRWYPPMDNDNTKWLLWDKSRLSLAVVLTGIRQMMREF